MSNAAIEEFEQQAAELVGAARKLLKEFEGRIGEVIQTPSVAVSDAGPGSADAAGYLAGLARDAQALVEQHRSLQARIEQDWQQRIDSSAQRAGAEQARAFGANLLAGLEERIAVLTSDVEAATHRFAWTTTLRWVLGIAIAIPIVIVLGVRSLVPAVAGLSAAQARTAMTQLAPCQIGSATHVCVAVGAKPQVISGPHGESLTAVQGM